MEATPGFSLHFLCWPCSSVWGTGLGLTRSPTSPLAGQILGLQLLHPWHESPRQPPHPARGQLIPPGMLRDPCPHPGTQDWTQQPVSSSLVHPRRSSTLHPLPFPARASRVHPAALEQAGQRERTLPCPTARNRSGLAAGPVPGPCGYLPPPFSAASVPNQSLIPARMKVSLLLLTNAIVFPMFSPAREQRLGPCRCQLC